MSEVFSDSYFTPVRTDIEYPEGTIGAECALHKDQFPDLSEARIVLIGVPEDRGSTVPFGFKSAPDLVREFLFRLYPGFPTTMFADIGNLKPGSNRHDTCAALAEVVSALIGEGKIPVIIGGSQDLTVGNYMAYERLAQTANLVSIDSRLDLGNGDEDDTSDRNYLSEMLLRQPNFLFNFSLVGYQTYLVNPAHLQFLDKLYFDAYRLGQFRGKLHEAEPVIRNADFASVDLSAVRASDAPGSPGSGPNGFSGEEMCQLMRYAGMSDKLTSIGIYGYSPDKEPSVTAELCAQMLWYFMEGVFNRKQDFPVADKAEYLRYRVVLKDHENEIIFYKSGRSERWWMDVPYPAGNRLRFQRHHLVPCSYEDYLTACRDEMPDRWWRTWQKLS